MTHKQLVLIFVMLLSISVAGEDDLVTVGQQMPPFNIVLQNGQKISSSTLKGKVVHINFFATWCGPCLAELPEIQEKVWEKYKSNSEFRMLVIGRDHDESVVAAFKAKYNFNLPLYPDKSKVIYSLFANQYIPRNYIIDKTGKVVYSSIGYTTDEFENMLHKLDELLK